MGAAPPPRTPALSRAGLGLGIGAYTAWGLMPLYFKLLLGVPALIGATGRSDLYYTLTSVALLAIAAGGVWLTFYIGRINIGQAAYGLAGGYVSAILVTATASISG